MSIVWWWTRSGMGKESAPLLLGLAWHAQRRTWEDQKTILADRVAAVFADSIAAVQDPLERVLALLRHLAGVVDQRDLLLALEGLGAGVCLVVARPVAGVTHQPGEVVLSRRDLGAKPGEVSLQCGTDHRELLGRPRLLVLAYSKTFRRGG